MKWGKKAVGILCAAALAITGTLLLSCSSSREKPSAKDTEDPGLYSDTAPGEALEQLGDQTTTELVEQINRESQPVFQPPSEACFGAISVDEPEKALAVIQQARDFGLLEEGEAVAFDPNSNFYRGRYSRDIEYYLDESILVLLWKEDIDGYCCTFAEVKIRDPRQLQRKLADDTYDSPNQGYVTEFAVQTQSVLAMNADYYRFRRQGIVVYDHELCRFRTETYTGSFKQYNCVDTLFVTEQGDFLYKYQGEVNTREDIERFVEENNIAFSLAFGPVLVEDGKPRTCTWYPLGEIDEGYSRAGIGQIDHCHYLYMSLNYGDLPSQWTVNEFAEHFSEKPVKTAYGLDGGQTAEVVFRGEPYNHVDFDQEREISDILYFASMQSNADRRR
jgi:exopolysaccharide biosynthesis protein